VNFVEPDGPAQKSGLRVGDRILAVHGRPVERSLDGALQMLDLQPGASVTIETDRRGQRRTASIRPDFSPRVTYRIEDRPEISDLERAVRNGWLRRPL
jgi:C-terminal processing protease CtpA/Prc